MKLRRHINIVPINAENKTVEVQYRIIILDLNSLHSKLYVDILYVVWILA